METETCVDHQGLACTNHQETTFGVSSIITGNLHKIVQSYLRSYNDWLKPGPIQFSQCHMDVIQTLRQKLGDVPISPYPGLECSSFLLNCDASDLANGCELLQVVDGK